MATFVPRPELVDTVKKVTKVSPLGTPYVDIPFYLATKETYRGYGKIIDNFDEAKVEILPWPHMKRIAEDGVSAGTTAGKFRCNWRGDNCYAVSESVSGNYYIGFREGNDIFTWHSNYHPDGTQLFCSPDGEPFILIMAKPIPDEDISPLDFVAFLFDGRKSVAIDPGVYHQAAFPLKSPSVVLKTKQGKVHGVVEIQCQDEFGVHLRIPGALTGIVDDPPPLKPYSALEDLDYEDEHTRPEYPTFRVDQTLLEETRAAAEIFAGRRYVDVTVVEANEESLAGYGKVVRNIDEVTIIPETWPQKLRKVLKGNEAGIRETLVEAHWEDQESKMVLKDAQYGTGAHLIGYNQGIGIDKVMYQADSNIAICPKGNTPFLIVISGIRNDDTAPCHFKGFYFDGSFGVELEKATWHSLPIFAGSSGCFRRMSGAVHSVAYCDFHEEFGASIRISSEKIAPEGFEFAKDE